MPALRFPTNSGTGDFDPVPAGSHIAICDMVVYLGLQPGTTAFPKVKPKVYLRWELPNERVEIEKDGKKIMGPRVVGKTYTASMHEKATLRHHLESWRGRQFTDPEADLFDVATVLGKPCMITIMQTRKETKTYADVAGIGPIPRGINPKTLIAEITPVLYTPESERQVYAQLPEWLRTKIDIQIIAAPQNLDSEEPTGNSYNGKEITDDDIPF